MSVAFDGRFHFQPTFKKIGVMFSEYFPFFCVFFLLPESFGKTYPEVNFSSFHFFSLSFVFNDLCDFFLYF